MPRLGSLIAKEEEPIRSNSRDSRHVALVFMAQQDLRQRSWILEGLSSRLVQRSNGVCFSGALMISAAAAEPHTEESTSMIERPLQTLVRPPSVLAI